MTKVDDIIEKALALPEPWIAKIILGLLESESYSDEMEDALVEAMKGGLGPLGTLADQPIGDSGRDEDQERADYRNSQ